jgi:hypothetical protein
MREHWLTEMYQRIKKDRSERLSRAVNLLRQKATSDPEVAEAVRLLHPWVTDQELDKQAGLEER